MIDPRDQALPELPEGIAGLSLPLFAIPAPCLIDLLASAGFARSAQTARALRGNLENLNSAP
jgi:hypothetical protein